MTPLGSGLRHDLRRAEASLAGASRLTGEDAFRRPVQAAMSDAEGMLFSGDSASLAVTAYLERPTACSAQTGRVHMVFRIVEARTGGALECSDGARSARLLEWEAGQARFDYDDGRGDLRNRSGALDPGTAQKLVRFVVTGPDAVVWTVSAARLPPPRDDQSRIRPDGGGDLDR